ncbi:hybrid nrps pks [Sesbania bispinosa]|nr:hybrid nrps pks [Sesbania bispinosa]
MAIAPIPLIITNDYKVYFPIPLAADDAKLIVRDDVTYVPEPQSTDKNLKVWKKTTLIPINIEGLRLDL